MNPSWPKFWAHVPDADRATLSEIITELLATGVLFGDAGREREMFLTARNYVGEIEDYLAVINMQLWPDPDRRILQARPMPGECGLTARFTKDETLVVLTLWRMYDDKRMEGPAESVIVSANDLDRRLKLYFENVEPPTEAHLERILSKLRGRRFIRFSKNERFGESQLEILPTLARAIPFENAMEWEQNVSLFNESRAANGESEPAGGSETEL
jgi:hypothetical protein